MCTAISYLSKDHYFGRNLDLEYSYQEQVTITPRCFPFLFRCTETITKHYAMIGIATVAEGYPLYYEATNEYGLSMAGLNFPGNAAYLPLRDICVNITPFEFIPWILGQCKSVSEARLLLADLNLVNIPFSDEYPLSPLHWMIADKDESIVVEPTVEGIKIYDDPIGVLTNNPPFDYHMHNLCNYLNLTSGIPENRFSEKINIIPYSRGMGAFGLPGDLSSASRFVRAAFTKLNSVDDGTESGAVSQFFHILSSVEQQRGCVKVENDLEITVYSCCCNTDKGIYYYKTYNNSQITAVDMHQERLDDDKIRSYPLRTEQAILWENRS